jgi:predicted TPR repeat methyltransferase
MALRKSVAHLSMYLVGVDLSSKMLGLAHRTGAYNRLVIGDAQNLPRGWAGSFDLVIASSSIQFFPEPKFFFEEVERTLKPGGAFIFSFDLENRRPERKLTRAGYFAFNKLFVEGALEASGMILLSNSPAILRQEPLRGAISGYIVVSEKVGDSLSDGLPKQS